MAGTTLALAPAHPANADPGCTANGVYVLWARGSGQAFDQPEAAAFKRHMQYALNAAVPGVPVAWAELGNLDGDYDPQNALDPGEYPAVAVADWRNLGGYYFTSVDVGASELVKHLNDRYVGDGPTGNGPCRNETVVVGGYSQGADVVGQALNLTGYGSLDSGTKARIAYVAMYGDPRANGLSCPSPVWDRGNAPCNHAGILAPVRYPYVPGTDGWTYKVGSWCDQHDGVCHRLEDPFNGSHNSAYRDVNDSTPSGWIWRSAAEIAQSARFKLLGCVPLCPAQDASVGPSNQVAMYTPLNWSFRVWNNTNGAASVQRFAVAVRGPGGNALDVPCANGTGVTIQPGQQWTCAALLPTGYGQAGSYTFWPDWLDYGGNWHHGQLGPDRPLILTPAPTLSTTGALSVGPGNPVPRYNGVFWSYRVRNTSGAYASIQKFVVAVRTPGGGNMDVTCNDGVGVALAPNQEWTCAAYNNNGYGSTGGFQFWADWQDYNGTWHAGQLSPTLTLYVT